MLQHEPPHWGAVEFFVQEQFVEVAARDSAAAAVWDPDGRDRMIECGMALQHFKLTLKRYGWLGRVDLFPDLGQASLAARVHLGTGGARIDLKHQLSTAVGTAEELLRLQTPVSDALSDWLSRAASSERSWLEFARCEGSRQRLMELVRSPVRIRSAEIQIQNETVTGSTGGRWRLGKFSGGTLHERLARRRKPALAIKVQETAETFGSNQFIAPDGIYAALKTKTDDKHGWLAAGQSLAGLLRHARTLGLFCAPFPNALRQPELRSELRTAIGRKGFMQAIVCFNAPRAELLAGVNELPAAMASHSA